MRIAQIETFCGCVTPCKRQELLFTCVGIYSRFLTIHVDIFEIFERNLLISSVKGGRKAVEQTFIARFFEGKGWEPRFTAVEPR